MGKRALLNLVRLVPGLPWAYDRPRKEGATGSRAGNTWPVALMIRRTLTGPGNEPFWMLISQVEHARVAGLLAAHWGHPPFSPLEPPDEVLAAVYHHDDGWAEWEGTPGVDAKLGRPLDYTEMPLAESLAIWGRSIEAAARLGDLAPYLVSGHFSALLRWSTTRQGSGADQAALGRRFLGEQERRGAAWLADWRQADPRQRSVAVARRALAFLQLFDALSLWLCCAERSEPLVVEPPGGPALALTPSAPHEIELSPWPLAVDRLEIEAAGRLVPVDVYPDAAAMAAVPSEAAHLRWSLVKPR